MRAGACKHWPGSFAIADSDVVCDPVPRIQCTWLGESVCDTDSLGGP